MAIHYGTRTAWVADVMTDLKKLIVPMGIPADLVFEHINDPGDLEDEPPNGEKYVAIYPGRIDTLDGVTQGSPANWVKSDGRFLIDIYSRTLKDARGRSVAAIQDATKGFSELTLKLAKKLHRETLADGDGNTYLHEAMRVMSVTFNRRRSPVLWSSATLELSLKFRADFS